MVFMRTIVKHLLITLLRLEHRDTRTILGGQINNDINFYVLIYYLAKNFILESRRDSKICGRSQLKKLCFSVNKNPYHVELFMFKQLYFIH